MKRSTFIVPLFPALSALCLLAGAASAASARSVGGIAGIVIVGLGYAFVIVGLAFALSDGAGDTRKVLGVVAGFTIAVNAGGWALFLGCGGGLVGNLSADPELKYTQKNRPVVNLSLAPTETWKDGKGHLPECTEWHGVVHRVVCRADTAENVTKYLKKGSPVFISCRLEYDDEEGVKRKVWEVKATEVGFLPNGQRSSQNEPATQSEASPPPGDDDIPPLSRPSSRLTPESPASFCTPSSAPRSRLASAIELSGA